MNATDEPILESMDEEVDPRDPSNLDDSYFFPIEADFIRSEVERDFHLYTKQAGNYMLFRSPDVKLSSDDASLLKQRGGNCLYVLENERDKYCEYIESSMLEAIMDSSIAPDKRADSLYAAGSRVVTDVLSDPESKRNILRSKQIVEGMALLIGNAPATLWDLVLKDRVDPYQVAHAMNTCAFALAMARRFDVHDEAELYSLGTGVLLKDVGHKRIPADILNKRGRLTREEWEVVRQHPALGLEIAQKAGVVDELTLIAIAQHHEMLDGTGYPNRLSGSEIHPLSRIATLVDIFDAMTSDRPYSKAMAPFPALMLIKNAYAGKIDPNVFREFVLLLKG